MMFVVIAKSQITIALVSEVYHPRGDGKEYPARVLASIGHIARLLLVKITCGDNAP